MDMLRQPDNSLHCESLHQQRNGMLQFASSAPDKRADLSIRSSLLILLALFIQSCSFTRI